LSIYTIKNRKNLFKKCSDSGKAFVFADRRFPLNKFNILLKKVKSSYIYGVLSKSSVHEKNALAAGLVTQLTRGIEGTRH